MSWLPPQLHWPHLASVTTRCCSCGCTKTSILRSLGAQFRCLHKDVWCSLICSRVSIWGSNTGTTNTCRRPCQAGYLRASQIAEEAHMTQNHILHLKLNPTLKVKNWHVCGCIYIVKWLLLQYASSSPSPDHTVYTLGTVHSVHK